MLHRVDRLVYAAVAVMLAALAFGLLGHTIWVFFQAVRKSFLGAATNVVLDLLLVLIVMELFRTVVGFLRQQERMNVTGDLVPFLVIAGISVIRRMISLGVVLGAEEVEGEASAAKFNHAMIELGVSSGVLLVIAMVLFVLRSYHSVQKHEDIHEPDEREGRIDGAAQESKTDSP
ncbi:hypothetical protein EON82_15920 [bacterium]|nr:MAG: hypothetical protein EON82_15920 [bacterium]